MGFGLKKKNKSKKNEIDFSQVMKGKKFPLLILDEHWIKLFPEEKMPQQIRELRNQLNDLLKKQSRVMEGCIKLSTKCTFSTTISFGRCKSVGTKFQIACIPNRTNCAAI